MGEIKSVKVDNWGVFFLQKLQNFFNKTDYCDLTLQFNDNSQLKVHRLVLSACTDYFNVLENSCDVHDDILIMPKDLQADVVVPIVNFMYTGTLEFEYSMYDRLFRTAKEMNMSVLLKLLEAHKKTNSTSNHNQAKPIVLNKQMRPASNYQQHHSGGIGAMNKVERTYSSPATRKLVPQTKTIIKTPISHFIPKQNIPETIAIVSKYRHNDSKSGPSRFEPDRDEDEIPEHFDSFNPISYESKPFITAAEIKEETYDDEDDEDPDDDDEDEESDDVDTRNRTKQQLQRQSTSKFEQLRKGYVNPNKRSASNANISQIPIKKPNLQEIKEYTEAARLRKQLEAEEFEDEPSYYDNLDDNHFDDDDDDPLQKKQTPNTSLTSNSSTKIRKSDQFTTIKKETDDKDTSKSPGSTHHAKIISEVLKQYPHLVKNIKNIKLKFLEDTPKETPKPNTSTAASSSKFIKKVISSPSTSGSTGPVVMSKLVKSQTLGVPAQKLPTKAQPKKIDSKTMHALIAKGAENMTGPWLCLRCGVNGRPISIPSYKSFRRHLVNIHSEIIDQKICELCGYKAQKKSDLLSHLRGTHNIKTAGVDDISPIGGNSGTHKLTGYQNKVVRPPKNPTGTSFTVTPTPTRKGIQHCIYCNKIFAKEISLYAHMRQNHKERARDDGVIDFSDEEQAEFDQDKYVPNDPIISAAGSSSGESKIKILSNITLPSIKGSQFIIDSSTPVGGTAGGSSQSSTSITRKKLSVPSSEAEALSNVASGIATSLGLIDHHHDDDSHHAVVEEEEHEDEHATIVDSTNDYNIINLPNQFIEEAMANVHGEYTTTASSSLTTAATNKEEADGHLMTKLVTSDGSELELTPSQKEEIISQLHEQTDNVVMVLNQDNFNDNQNAVNNTGTNEAINIEQQNIVVVYSQEQDQEQLQLVVSDDNSNSTQDLIKDVAVVCEKNDKNLAETQKGNDVEKLSGNNDLVPKKELVTVKEENLVIEKEVKKEETVEEIKVKEENIDDDKKKKSAAVRQEPSTIAIKRESQDELDKMKILAALEGDWTDEEMEKEGGDEGETEEDKNSKSIDEETATTIDELSQDEIKEEDGNSSAQPMEVDEEEVTKESDKKVDVKETLKKPSNPEIKTLINDWGDDDDEI